ncbi:MAG: hypothetical protein Tsb002_14000 [Wenzhouxiangellaceae bacterium]
MHSRIRHLLTALLAALVWSHSALAQRDVTDDLVTVGRAWGLLKYTHPEVTRCAVDWDQALLQALQITEQSTAANPLDLALRGLLNQASGNVNPAAVDDQTPGWISQSGIAADLQGILSALSQRTVDQQCYVAATPGTNQAEFSDDGAEVASTVGSNGRYVRGLAALRYWNAIEYFFPYRDDIGRDWAAILRDFLPEILNADQSDDYVFAMRRFTASIEDGHAFFEHPIFQQRVGWAPPPFTVRTIDGRMIVEKTLPQAAELTPGDEVVTVEGIAISEWRDNLSALSNGSNPIGRESTLNRYILNGVPTSGQAQRNYGFRRPDGSEYRADLPLNFVFSESLASNGDDVWQIREVEQRCSYGVVDLARLETAQLGQMLNDLRDTDGIIFDARNYPNGVIWSLADLLYGEARPLAAFEVPDLSRPGQYNTVIAQFGGQRHVDYSGRIIVLFNETTQSQAEYTVMGLQAYGNTLTIGSQTAGADGDITQMNLPGGITAFFTGLGVYYPDGTPTQRFGIVPDLHVYPTRTALTEGRDELLDTALNCDWLDTTPPTRRAEAGIYWNPERNGEGVEIYRLGEQVAAIQYGFDEQGQPEWWLGSAGGPADQWSTTLRRFERDANGAVSAQDVATAEFDFHRGPYNPLCARVDQQALDGLGSFNLSTDDGTRSSCLSPLLNSTASAGFSGAWRGPQGEEGWGLSLFQLNGQLTAALYIYDLNGQPRWLLGTANYNGADSVTITMRRFQGYCRTCPATELSSSEAGAITLQLTTPSQQLSAGNTVSIDINQASADDLVWQRQNMPIRLLTPVRN